MAYGSRGNGALRLGLGVGMVAARPIANAVAAGIDTQRRARRAIGSAAEHAALDTLDALAGSRFAEQAIDRLMASALVEHVVHRTFASRLVDLAGTDLARYAVIERLTERFVASEGFEHALERAEAADVPERLADRLLAGDMAERIATRIVDGPELGRIVEAALASPGTERLVARVVSSPDVERLVAQVIESRLVDAAVEQLLKSDDLWLLVEEIVGSPAVTAAIAQQGIGFADQVAGVVRDRSERADARLERVARRLVQRRPHGAAAKTP